MKISRGSGGWAELQQLPRQLRNELHLLHTGQGNARCLCEELGAMVGTWECRNPETGLAWPAAPATDQRGVKEPPPGESGASAAVGCEGSTETQRCAGFQKRLQGRFHRLKMNLEC